MPVGLLMTVPVPVPVWVILKVNGLKYVTLMLELPSFAAASWAYTTIVLLPFLRLVLKFQVFVPVTFCRTPPFKLYCTLVTPMLSLELPAMLRLELVTTALLVGLVMFTIGEAISLNVAVTFFAAFIDTVQAPVPVHAPVHPTKLEPVAGVGVSVTVVPSLKSLEQVAPQSMPAGLLLAVPTPVPALLMLKVRTGGV